MTHLSVTNIYQPKRYEDNFIQTNELNYQKLSIVVPVKDNQDGIERLLNSFFAETNKENYPSSIIIVDNNSSSPLLISEKFKNRGIAIERLECKKFGPGAARNVGWKYAQNSYGSEWILFVDSDCLFTPSSISGYSETINGSVAYQGVVLPVSKDWMSNYYSEEKILEPRAFFDKDIRGNNEPYFRPNYLVTANTMINVDALQEVNGFNELYLEAAGEDIDLGYRLSQIGQLSYASSAAINHDFLDGNQWVKVSNVIDTIKRFERYGRGNKKLEVYHDTTLVPDPTKLFIKDIGDYVNLKNQIFAMDRNSNFTEPQKGFIMELTMWALKSGYDQMINYEPSRFSKYDDPQNNAAKVIQDAFMIYSKMKNNSIPNPNNLESANVSKMIEESKKYQSKAK